MSVTVTEEEFEQLVEDALGRIPDTFLDQLENVVFAVEADPPPGEGNLLGRYLGLPVTERGIYSGMLPDVISLYQRPLQRICATVEDLAEQVYVTLVHEIGHYFGLEDDELEALDWG